MSQHAKKPILLTLQVDLLPDSKLAFIEWQAQMNALIAAQPGFVSLEFLSPSARHNYWLVVQRFTDETSASQWKNSQRYQDLIDELERLAVKEGIRTKIAEESSLSEGVTEVFITEVNKGKEEDYRRWSAKIHQYEARFPGFRGVYVQSPTYSNGRHWITLLQFDNMQNLEHWLQSSERQELLKESTTLITSLETHRMISPYAGWFASIAGVGEAPPAWKQAMIVLLVLFPIVMIELKYLNPVTAPLNKSLGTFIGNAISVSLLSFPMMPIAIRTLRWWLLPQGENRRLKSILGTFLILMLYLLEILLFWQFL